MQFVKNGPEVPERLLQAHEDGRVVFFCGAGISYPAGLPSFAGLTEQIYADLNFNPDPVQREAIKAKQFDRAIDLLEERVVGKRDIVRQSLAQILTPNLATPNATAAHDALLTLSRNCDGRTRLVTTNVDRLFEKVIADQGLDVPRHYAPQLPVPKNRWNGLVYLHGLLPNKPVQGNLDHLVVSSGDFGRAYLIERWAARFVGELFRNYTICFVGYSIDDPVLRYMADATAADGLLGDSPLEMFAFGSYSEGQEDERTKEWEAKNVIPILYCDDTDHESLYHTLRSWAEIYHGGISGKENIVARYAGLDPTKSTKQDNFVGRMLWALSDSSGLPARRFAECDPAPEWEWLETFSNDIYDQADLSRFGVQPDAKRDDSLKFSLICRPTDYTRAPRMTLVDEVAARRVWDDVMYHLARWLVRYLDEPKLVLWLTQRSGPVHPEFAEKVERRLRELDELERDGKTEELNRIRSNAPRAVPRPMMRTLWRLLLTGLVKTNGPAFNRFRWVNFSRWRYRFEHGGLTAPLRLELRDMLTPRVSLREPFRWDGDREECDPSVRFKDLVDWKIVLSIDNAPSALKELRQSPRWREALPDLLDDFSALLRDAMDLARELGGANDQEGRSFIYRPSIGTHRQNTRLQDRAVLIELTRDAWLATKEIAPERARRAAEDWYTAPYPVFRRLAFFAATHEEIIPERLGLGWLLADDHWWLWSVETQREAIRLLVALAPRLDGKSLAQLERAVLAGPSSSMYKDGIEPERFARIVDHGVWLRLAKMHGVRVALGKDAKAKLDELSLRYPKWQLKPDEHDEFPLWRGDSSELTGLVAAPRRPRELAAWLKQNPGTDVFQDDGWSSRCRDDFRAAACALCALASDNTWPTVRWCQALHVWSEENLIKRSWHYMAPVLAKVPGDRLLSLAHELGWWLKKVVQALDPDEALFLRLCEAILNLDYQEDADENDDPVMQAINHPVGHVAEALLNWWTRNSLKDSQGLPDTLRPVFTKLCDMQVGSFRHSRVLLASRVITLFRVDGEWTTQYLLPLFDWSSSKMEARAAWSGFFWSPRLYPPLMELLKGPFLDTASHYDTLDPYSAQYAGLLTSAALDCDTTFTEPELAEATKALPESGLLHAAQVLIDELEAAGERRTEFWRNRVLPYIRSIWPKEHDRKTPKVSESLGRLCIAAGDVFPEALKELRHWLQPPAYLGDLMYRLKESKLCGKFPKPSLDFLALVTGDGPLWENELGECLVQIRAADPQLEDEERFRKLRDLARKSGNELE